MSDASPPADAITDDSARRWYSIAEAADYLRISQPTIFRWMKDGILSFYKVGGSTRFTQHGLDAVIEKTTGTKEAEAAAGRCARCGHSVLVPGRLQGAGKLYFKADKTKFWVATHSLIPTTARVCVACGYLQFFVDTDKLSHIRAKEDDGE